MDITKLKSIRMSLMKMESDINESAGPNEKKADYTVKGSATFNITPIFYANLLRNETVDLTEGLLKAMYEELLEKIKDVDSVGIWIDYDNKIIDNAMKIQALEDMKKFGAEGIVPIYELFKMTLPNKNI